MYGGNNSTTVQAPQQSAEEKEYYRQKGEDLAYARDQQRKKDEADAAKIARTRTSGLSNLPLYAQNLQKQLESGAITLPQAEDLVSKFQQQFGLEQGDVISTVKGFRDYDVAQLPTRQKTLVETTIESLLGRDATAEETQYYIDKIKGTGGAFNQASVGDFIRTSDEYKNKVGKSYIQLYNQSYYGPGEKELVKGKKGAPDWYRITERYTINLDDKVGPQLDQGLQAQTGLKFGELPKTFTGSVADIENIRQKERQRDEFAYNSGLLRLQGQIDSDIQKIRNKGTRDVAELSSKASIYGGLTSGFFS